ncbi:MULTISPECIES: salicylate synthase [Streptomyces]|uniref:Salicylate synthase n=1 Tax=Streptomyces spororaveus TaxID=284039 RepID=A0ABQ3T9Q9_9ACTN|nr:MULTISPECIES: salicylate synthase [Streptomyces]MCM9082446.1 salicylate synthase [Streptomyces spororaveus]MCX5302979.1 salicylate synthase [Streptomyces sp. NBC_00160]GHI77139.1 salicylate synthase [Streptomyces spororaveus]
MVERRKYHERLLAPVLDPLGAVIRLAQTQGEPDHVVYEGPEGWSFAAGPVAELRADRDGLVLTSEAGERSVGWTGRPLRQIPALLDTVPVEDWRVYGWAGFDIAAAKEGMFDLVGDDPFLHLMVPATEVRLHSTGTLLRALDADDLDTLEARLEAGTQAEFRAVPVDVSETDAEPYKRSVGRAVEAIREGRLQKVILSRVVPVEHPVDLIGTYGVGRRANTPARSFLLSLGGVKATGFSPETVVEVTSDGLVTTQPLAGTRARTGDGAVDTALKAELLADSKEIFEHAISVKVAYDELVELCGEASVEVPEFMVVRERGTVQHLASSVRGQLVGGDGAWDAFAALFPAVTASGVPKPAAYRVIRELESSERGLYSGAVLTFDSGGGLDAALVLRTVFQQDGRTWLRAGAGIVEQSRPERELTETCEKMASVATYIVPLGA